MLQVFLSYLPYALVTTFTPGPNNIMSLYAVSSSGWSKGREVIAGILAGFSCVMVVCILFCHELAIYLPGLVKYLKYIGAAYIIWLAIHIALSQPGESQSHSVSFTSALFLALSNVKVILFLITIFTAYVIPSGAGLPEMFVHGVIITAISLIDWITWGAAGGLLQSFIASHFRAFNITMGVILLWCAVQILS